MRCVAWVAVFPGCIALVAGNAAGQGTDLPVSPGFYEIAARLELPHVETQEPSAGGICADGICEGCSRTETVSRLATLLPILSSNNPLAKCPRSNARFTDNVLEFEIVCTGGNAARGHARYDFTKAGFEARIDMKMGGKNMTMAEHQFGRLAGQCVVQGQPLQF